jgi:RecA/RadA recombinase
MSKATDLISAFSRFNSDLEKTTKKRVKLMGFSDVTEFIPTGNFLLNAQMSGSLRGGYPNARSLGIGGDSGTGKTFLCLNAIKNAQDMDYAVFYVDTEGALDKKDFVNFGINMDMLNYKRIGIISEVKFFVHDIIKMKEDNPELKIMIIVDSLTHLETNKEVEDRDKGSNAQDMGLRAKELRQLFKSMTLDLSNLKIPLIFTSHTYASMDKYTPKAMSGGSGPLYSASVVMMLSKGALKAEDDVTTTGGDAKEKTGVKVRSTTDKNRLAKPEKIEIHISFHKGMNPYVGLQDYLSWENCGVARGNKLTEKEFSKLKGAESESCSEFEVDGEKFYFLPKPSARNFVIKFSGDLVPWREIFTDRVFTDDVIDELDKNVIQPKFKYSSLADVEAAEMIELQMDEDSNDETED